MPLDDPLRPPHVRSTDGHVGRRHLPALPVRADGADLKPEVQRNVSGRPPLSLRVWGGDRHGPSMANWLGPGSRAVRLRRVSGARRAIVTHWVKRGGLLPGDEHR